MVFVLVASASSQTIEKQALTHLDTIKAIKADADEKTVAGYNKSLDEAWKFFMLADRNYETFSRATTFMMKTGGSEGRAAMLRLSPKDFDAQSQEYFERVRPQIEATSYETLRKQFSTGRDFAPLTEDTLKKRLAAMYENYGKDDTTEPSAVLDSTLPRTFLINELLRIRARMFRRLSDEGLSDVVGTNTILNALYYRPK